MHALPILLLATLASTAPLAPRADTTITDALGPVLTSLQSLDTAINGLTSGDPQSAVPILGASDAANKALATATTTISGADNLDLIGALGLQQTATGLTTQVQTTVGDLAGKKSALDQLGVTSVAVNALKQQQTASQGLSDALLSKVPAIAKPIAKQSTDKITAAVSDAITKLSAPAAGNSTAAAPAAAAPASAAPDMPAAAN